MSGLEPSKILSELWQAPEDVTFYGRDEKYFVQLGYTIYRTDYSSGTEALWLALITTLEDGIKEDVSSYFEEFRGTEKEDKAIDKVMSLIRIDPRSDESMLADCTMDQLRTIYNNHVGGKPLNTEDSLRRSFLVADETVFEALRGGTSWVKAVEVDYDAIEHDLSRNPRLGMGQKYWGWMKLATDSLFFLWNDLVGNQFFEIAPRMDKSQKYSAVYSGGMEDPDVY